MQKMEKCRLHVEVIIKNLPHKHWWHRTINFNNSRTAEARVTSVQ